MEKVAKLLLLTLAIMVVVLASDVEGIRKLKEAEKKGVVYHKDNFIGGIGGTATFPGPGFTGIGFGPSIFCTYPGGCTSTTTPTTLPLTPIPVGVGSPPHA